MKVNELSCKDLMVGDWVRIKITQHNTKVTNIDANSVYTEVAFPIRYNEIEPISLTPEILEKNGFNYDEDRKVYLMGVIFQVKPEKYGLFSFEICGCPYPLNTVHELQHALRLCGIEKEIKL